MSVLVEPGYAISSFASSNWHLCTREYNFIKFKKSEYTKQKEEEKEKQQQQQQQLEMVRTALRVPHKKLWASHVC